MHSLTRIQTISLGIGILLSSLSGQALEFSAVSPNEVQAARCVRLQSTSRQQMEDFLFSQFEDPEYTIDSRVGPFQFVDEKPELIQLFQNIHTEQIFGGRNYTMLKNQKRCSKVLCVLQENYGKDEALKMLYIQAKFGFPTSPAAALKSDNYQKWRSDQLDRLILALESIPPTFFPIKDRHLLRFLEGHTLATYGDDGDSVLANARIDIFDRWDKSPKLTQVYALVHELGHVVGSLNNLDKSPEWKSLAKKNHVSQYAMTNHFEDFAESFAAYRFAPEKLKAKAPEKYQYLKERVFKGLQFRAQKDCELPFQRQIQVVENRKSDYKQQLQWSKGNVENVKKQLARVEQVLSVESLVFKKCAGTYLEELENHTDGREKTLKCIQAQLVGRATEITLIEQGRENARILKKPFEAISVPRAKLVFERTKLRDRVAQELERLYDKSYLTVGSSRSSIENYINANSSESALGVAAPAEILVKIVSKSLENLSPMEKLKAQLFGPHFSKVLP
jgi:hypothetical protein